MLRQQSSSYISGEEICRQLAVSRTAIWKHIQALRKQGYDIEAHPRRGYCLQAIPDRLLANEIQAILTTRLLGKEIYYFDTVDSTNNIAKKEAAQGCPEGSIVLAEEQLTGRGRLARGWFSPANAGIWLSVVLRPPFGPYDAPKCTLMAAVAITKAIKNVVGIECGIKWPNDILYDGKKIVGILTEMSAQMDAINYVVLGMGINVNITQQNFPAEINEIATSLAEITGYKVARLDLLNAVLSQLEQDYQRVINEGFSFVLEQWRHYTVTLGQVVDVFGIDKQFSGLAVDIDEDGALLIRTANGLEKVLAGDVSLRRKEMV
jgi:BirA family biotin operon repressor/biotin-[acetyl-CoA-carboxylase] ligase